MAPFGPTRESCAGAVQPSAPGGLGNLPCDIRSETSSGAFFRTENRLESADYAWIEGRQQSGSDGRVLAIERRGGSRTVGLRQLHGCRSPRSQQPFNFWHGRGQGKM